MVVWCSQDLYHTHIIRAERERERERQNNIYIYIYISYDYIVLYDMCLRTLNKRKLIILGRWMLHSTAAVSQLQLCPRIIELVFERPGSLGPLGAVKNLSAGCIPIIEIDIICINIYIYIYLFITQFQMDYDMCLWSMCYLRMHPASRKLKSVGIGPSSGWRPGWRPCWCHCRSWKLQFPWVFINGY